ncbi:hypothetical protein [Nocardiopsis aegyptia]|uniref:Uncharacterized protein n=1 Tax=Nocardiopsis aegyptia TaxID=220378 RepID=A0A7Z0EJW7_9ACTN|nr:hypothetical protein [Nocardiopsis aegyptia]NYJ33457.1 hypothetical protein [Nocardiopsis aegyptia]
MDTSHGGFPQPRRETTDRLVDAIANDQLDVEQRQALADLVNLLAAEMVSDSFARPGTLMDRTIEEAGAWGNLRSAWMRLHSQLYPRVVRS